MQELDRRYRTGDGAVGSQAVPKIVVTDPRPISNQFREKERTKDAKEVIMAANAQRNHVEEGKCVADAFVQKFPSIDQTKAIEKDVEKQMEGRERQRKSDHDSRGHKLKDREKERKVKSKDKDRDNKKEKKEEKEKVREISKPSDEQSNLKGSGKDSIDACNNKAPDLLQLNDKYSVAEGSLGKHKQLEMNGYLLGKKKKVKEISKPPTGKPILNGSGSNFPNDCSNKALDLLQRNGKNSAAGVTLGKRKELEMDGHLHGEKKKVKEINKQSTCQPNLKESGTDFPDDCRNKALDLLQRNGKNKAAGVTLGKRKELEMNGNVHGELFPILKNRGLLFSIEWKHI